MLIRITSKRQVTFPAHVLDSLGLRSGDYVELVESADGFLLRPRRVDLAALAPLRGRLKKGEGKFDLTRFREQTHDSTLRD